MQNVYKILAVGFLVVVVAACGPNKTTKTTKPVTQTQNIDPKNPTQDPRIPDLTGGLNIVLKDAVNYTGLKDLAHGVYPGDNNKLITPPVAVIKLGPARSAFPSGTILIAFEDVIGFWGAKLNSFWASNTGSTLDAIFSDDEFVLRVVGAIQGVNIAGAHLYYRVRTATETTQCKNVVNTCTYSGYWPSQPPCPQPDNVGICRAYMNTTNTQVKDLGTIQTGPIIWSN